MRFALRPTIGAGGQGSFGRPQIGPGTFANAVRTAANIAFAAGGHHVRTNQGGHVTTTYHQRGFEFRGRNSRRERIARLDTLATLLDTAFVIPGTNVRFGLDALIGLVPGIGDAITTALSLFIVHEAYQLGAPGHLIARMLGNVAIDGLFGSVPVVGDAFDVAWRANVRNVRLLREWLSREGFL